LLHAVFIQLQHVLVLWFSLDAKLKNTYMVKGSAVRYGYFNAHFIGWKESMYSRLCL